MVWGTLATSAALAATLGAPTPVRVVVLPAEVNGDAPQLPGLLETAVEDAARQAGAEPVVPSAGCASADCAAADAGGGYVLRTVVDVDVSDFSVTSTLYDGEGNAVGEERGACEICTQDEAAALAAEGARALIEPATTQAEKPAPEPLMAAEPEPDRQSTFNPRVAEAVGWGAVGVGAAALISGIVLLAIDGRSAKNNCDAPHVDAAGNCEFQWDTRAGGLGLTLAGAVTAGGGAGLIVYSRRKNGRPQSELAVSTSALTVRF